MVWNHSARIPTRLDARLRRALGGYVRRLWLLDTVANEGASTMQTLMPPRCAEISN
jgi:hypothetical protein